MKTAISLPNDLFALAEECARRRGMSRSELYATALRHYLNTHRYEGLTEAINQACVDLATALPNEVANQTRQRMLEVEW